jgi:CDP-diacylglycerol--glycerol-3-phosphate 3-phosphatidyltransferase
VENNKNSIITFPNILSVLRIILSPIIFFAKDNKYILFCVLIIIGLTDILDGYIARKYKKQTIIGAWLDSISDFVFYILLVIYSVVFQFDIINRIKYIIIVIITLKLFTIIIGYIKYKKLSFLHTYGNKISGIAIFIEFCLFILLDITIIVDIGIIFSILCSLEELIITIIGKKYNENIKGIWEIKNI